LLCGPVKVLDISSKLLLQNLNLIVIISHALIFLHVGSAGSATSFWDLLRAVAQQQLEEKDAEAFCDTFKLLHEELVNKALSLDAIERIAKRWPLATK
jgi:hypothetical protein